MVELKEGTFMDRFVTIQEELTKQQIDAWILVDYENRNPTMVSFLGDKMLTRKILMVFPKDAKPYLICHVIDTIFLQDPETQAHFDLKVYHTWQEMLKLEKECFHSYHRVYMDISENGLLPRVSLADYGSVSYLQSLGIEIRSSANLLQIFQAQYGEKSYQLQRQADALALKIKDEAFAKIKADIEQNGVSDEYRIQQFIAKRFHEEGMVYDDPPIVAINHNASNPHYGPTSKVSSPIHVGDVVLIDMWAKMDDPLGVYADITWMGYVGKKVPAFVAERFQILKEAIDHAVSFLEENLSQREVLGYEVDDVVRKDITDKGYGEYFTHRTGHNISVDISPHGPGANIDDYESHDTRALINGTSFSLEPGIYAPDFGMRSETNVYVENRHPIVVAGRQKEVIAILK